MISQKNVFGYPEDQRKRDHKIMISVAVIKFLVLSTDYNSPDNGVLLNCGAGSRISLCTYRTQSSIFQAFSEVVIMWTKNTVVVMMVNMCVRDTFI